MHTQSSCPSRSSSCLRLSAFLLLSIVFVFVRIPYADAADPECACTDYLNNAVAGADAYCFAPVGTSTFCIPYTSPCQSFAGLNTNPCAKKTNSPTTPPPTASTTCACTVYLFGAIVGDPAYCAQTFGTSQFCYPNQAQCSPQNGLPTSTCFAPTSSPTQKPVAPTSPPTTQSTTCACGAYLGGAIVGQSNYCYQTLGTSQLCYPGSTQCSPQNGLPTLSCSASTPTNSPTATVPPTAGSPTCACAAYLDGASASPTSAYCTQTLGTSQFCYPDANPCPAKNSLPTSRCLPANTPTNPPVTKQPSKAPATSTPSKSPVKPVPTTARPTAKPGPTAKPVTVKPSTATPTKKPVPTAPTPPTVPTPPTLSPTQKPTSKGGLSPIAGLVIFLVIAFILFGGYQYAMEKRQEKKARVQQEQQQQQQQAPQQDLSPVSVI